jgi:hypothetical protein
MMSKRELRGMQTLLEEGKPGLGFPIGMYGGTLGGIAVGSFFIATSIGYYGNTFGLVVGGVALTAAVTLAVIGTLSLVKRLGIRGKYNARIEEVRGLLLKSGRPDRASSPSPLLIIAQW